MYIVEYVQIFHRSNDNNLSTISPYMYLYMYIYIYISTFIFLYFPYYSIECVYQPYLPLKNYKRNVTICYSPIYYITFFVSLKRHALRRTGNRLGKRGSCTLSRVFLVSFYDRPILDQVDFSIKEIFLCKTV